MTTELFQTIQSNYTTTISPKEISSSINDILTKKIKEDIEGKCITDGYVKRDSVKIINRSIGSMILSHFNGTILYHITFSADICNPFEGMLVKATVNNINKMGILATAGENEYLNILLAKQHHIDNEEFNKIDEKDIIYITVIGKRFEFGDNQISIIGKLVNKPIKEKKQKLEEEEDDEIEFNNKHRAYKWLGTFNIDKPFEYKGRKYATIEHALNAQKNMDEDYQDLFTIGTETYIGSMPNVAKKTGNKSNMKKMKKKIIPDWATKRIQFMKEILMAYYEANPDLKQKLIDTGSSVLLYRGVGADTFWGLKQGIDEGENNYGKLLMALRKQFSK